MVIRHDRVLNLGRRYLIEGISPRGNGGSEAGVVRMNQSQRMSKFMDERSIRHRATARFGSSLHAHSRCIEVCFLGKSRIAPQSKRAGIITITNKVSCAY